MGGSILIKDAVYQYPGAKSAAVDHVSLSIGAGEFVAVLGRNGSGKSTLAKLLNALILPQSGEIYVDGIAAHDEANCYAVREKCGMVFQNPDNQIVATIVEEDCAFGLENLGVPSGEIRTRVQDALDKVGMHAYAAAAPHMLSGGQKQRVAIAGVIAMRPDILVFDESTAMLDPIGRGDVFSIARQLNREGITVVWITHFMDEAARASRVVVMDTGKIALDGAPEAVFSDTAALAGFGLEPPEMAALASRLREAGLPLPAGILTVEEMAVELCRLK